MMNKVMLGLLISLLVLVGGLGYYAWTSQQQLDLLREELSTFQNEQAARTEAIGSEIASLNSELQSGIDSLGTDIDENSKEITELQDDVDSSQDAIQSLEKEVSSNLDKIDIMMRNSAKRFCSLVPLSMLLTCTARSVKPSSGLATGREQPGPALSTTLRAAS